MSETKIQAWLIDLDGTLYHARPMKFAMAAELALLGASSIKALRAFRPLHEVLREEYLHDPEVRFLPNAYEEQLARAAAQSGISSAKMRATIEDWMIRRPAKWMHRFRRHDLLKRIEDFRAAGGKTALVSDYPANEKARIFGITELFDTIVSSGDHKGLTRLKPAPDAFLLAAQELGVPPEACLVIGDRDDADGEGARAAGMRFELVK